jgi:protoporphyrinogen oxidase
MFLIPGIFLGTDFITSAIVFSSLKQGIWTINFITLGFYRKLLYFSKMKRERVVVVGAGPAGLAVAWKLLKNGGGRGFRVEVYEQDGQVGGLARTVNHDGYRFDLGGHRFYTKFSEIEELYDDLLGKNMLVRKRLSRIYYNKKFFSYPLEGFDVIKKLGPVTSAQILLSYIGRRMRPYKEEKNFNQWVGNRFGDKLFSIFFKSYTEKVWGIPTDELSAQWASQRIQNFSFAKAVVNAFLKVNPGNAKTIITRFRYPKHGPGMFYERMERDIEKWGGRVYKNCDVVGIKTKRMKIVSVMVKPKRGRKKEVRLDKLVSTMPLDRLMFLLKPSENMRGVLKGLSFRNFVSVALVVKKNPFPDNWIYIHDPDVKVGRVQNFRNWSPYMTRDRKYTPIGMEYFASEGDEVWNMSEEGLVGLAKKEAEVIGLFSEGEVVRGYAHRAKNAYPIYDLDYSEALKLARKHVEKFGNLHVCGRGGLFRYNNMDHSILTGFFVAENLLAGRRLKDVWSINDQDEYLEEKQ